MSFSVTKTQLIVFGKKNKIDCGNYAHQLGGVAIEQFSSVKYLGITLQSDLKFDKHIHNITNKAMKVLGMIKRTLYQTMLKNKMIAYMTLCRPLLEYACQVWDPYKKQDIHEIEMVQNRAIRFICNLKGRDDSITEARNKINLQTLETRRRKARLKLLLSMMDDEAHPVLHEFFTNETNTSKSEHHTRAQNQHLLPSLATNTNIFFQSFLPRTIRDLRGEDRPGQFLNAFNSEACT